VKLCGALPEKIDADAVWRFGRDKPCYQNIKVVFGERMAQDIVSSQEFDDWQRIASDEWSITMRERGRNWKRNANFNIEGRAAKDFVASLKQGGIGSYLWRIYCIRELAVALKQGRLDKTIQQLMDWVEKYDEIPIEQVDSWTKQFAYQVGLGWGHTTAYHMLTDLGVAVKPDIHLTKSAICMGLLAPEIPAQLADGKLVHDSKIQHLAAKSAMELSKLITPEACGTKRCAMREVDKVLMEWSRRGLARPLQ